MGTLAAILFLATAADGAPTALGPNLIALKDGRRFNLVCAGHGSPVLIFEQGSGESILDWKKVQEGATALTRTCFYDRAGLGYSDPSDKAANIINIANDLHALLHAADIRAPVIIVGHSLGGLIATFYADRFPHDVRGLVLVDPSFATQFAYPVSASGQQEVEQEQREYMTGLHKCLELAETKQLSEADTRDCFDLAPGLSEAEARYLVHQYISPSYYKARLSESENFLPVKNWKSVDGLEEQRARHDFGATPVEVLTAGIPVSNKRKSDADNKSFAEWWRQGHRELAARSTRGGEIVVKGAKHNIQNDRPNAVLAAIEKAVVAVRDER